jgi:hypothetical protein
MAPSSESWSLAFCKGNKDCSTAFFNGKITCEKYVQVILRQFFRDLQKKKDYGWNQQGSVTAQTAHTSMQALSGIFGDRNIRTGIWQAHSPEF